MASPFVYAVLDVSMLGLDRIRAHFDACRRHAAEDGRFEVIQQPTRLGWVYNSNFLLEQVRSPFAVFVFHDDLLAPTDFERLASAREADPLAAMTFSEMHFTPVTVGRSCGGTTLWAGSSGRRAAGSIQVSGGQLSHADEIPMYNLPEARRPTSPETMR